MFVKLGSQKGTYVTAVFYSSTFFEPFRGSRDSIFELSIETQSLKIALAE